RKKSTCLGNNAFVTLGRSSVTALESTGTSTSTYFGRSNTRVTLSSLLLVCLLGLFHASRSVRRLSLTAGLANPQNLPTTDNPFSCAETPEAAKKIGSSPVNPMRKQSCSAGPVFPLLLAVHLLTSQQPGDSSSSVSANAPRFSLTSSHVPSIGSSHLSSKNKQEHKSQRQLAASPSNLLASLVAGLLSGVTRDSDDAMRLLYAKWLGAVGPIDPSRMPIL
ncbi:unnamed protein product, partial [Protopolystoma xenopodis]